MRQKLELTVDSECEYCQGTGIAERGRERLCECVEASKPQKLPHSLKERLEAAKPTQETRMCAVSGCRYLPLKGYPHCYKHNPGTVRLL